MSAFCEDSSRKDVVFQQLKHRSPKEQLPLNVLEWYSDGKPSSETSLSTASDLIARDQDATCGLRIVLAPLKAHDDSELDAIRHISQYYSFPSSFFSEDIQAVSFSFGSQLCHSDPNVELAWSHFQCKDISPVENQHSRETDGARSAAELYWGWRMSNYYLHSRTRGERRCVTLFCFGAPREVADRFRRLLHNSSWRDVQQEPFLLFTIVYDQLYILLDTLAWNLADVFRPTERSTMHRARLAQSSNSNHVDIVDFAELHNTAKNCIYMNEAVDAMLLTLEYTISHLSNARKQPLSMLSSAAVQSLTYRKTITQSTQLRLRSLSSRMDNIISLNFNLVTQQDSRTMKNDSNAMKAIAVLTLIFLPVTGIASVFSTPFFNVGSGQRSFEESSLTVAKCFWIFWAFSIPMTAVMFFAWLLWYRNIKSRRVNNLEGWRSFADTWRSKTLLTTAGASKTPA